MKTLDCNNTPVSDLSPLRDLPLSGLICSATRVSDLSPLKDAPLTWINCDFDLKRDRRVLESITTVREINGQPAAEVLKDGGAVPKP